MTLLLLLALSTSSDNSSAGFISESLAWLCCEQRCEVCCSRLSASLSWKWGWETSEELTLHSHPQSFGDKLWNNKWMLREKSELIPAGFYSCSLRPLLEISRECFTNCMLLIFRRDVWHFLACFTKKKRVCSIGELNSTKNICTLTSQFSRHPLLILASTPFCPQYS